MPPSRRRILTGIGAVGTATIAGVGRVGADEDESCEETVFDVEFDQVGSPALLRPRALPEEQIPAAVGFTAVTLPYFTEPFTVDEDAFDGTDLPEKRVRATLTWNETEEDPTTCGFTMERKNFSGEWEQIADERNQSQTGGDGPMTENREDLEAVDGEEHLDEADNETQEDQRNEIIVDGGQEYRFVVWPQDGVVTPHIEAEFQAFDPDC